MNSSQRSSEEAEWDCYRPKITRLYMVENRFMPDVRNIMESEDGFSKSKSQYEAQFKKWQLKKYLTSEEWRAVDYEVAQLKIRGIQHWTVYLSGVPLKTEKVWKEIKRNRSQSWSRAGPPPQLPRTVEVRPSTSAVSEVGAYQLATVASPLSRLREPQQVSYRPSSRSQLSIPRSQLRSSRRKFQPLTYSKNSTQRDNLTKLTPTAESSLVQAFSSTFAPDIFNALNGFHELFPDGLWSMFQVGNLEVPMSALNLPFTKLHYNGESQLIKNDAVDSLETSGLRLIEILRFLIVNKIRKEWPLSYPGSDHEPCKLLFNLLRVQKSNSLINQLLSGGGGSDVLGFELLRESVAVGDQRLFSQLFSLCVNKDSESANTFFKIAQDLLQSAASHQQMQMIKVIVEHGRRLNDCAMQRVISTLPLSSLLRTRNGPRCLEIITWMIDQGASVNTVKAESIFWDPPLRVACDQLDHDLFDVLIKAGANVDIAGRYGQNYLCTVLLGDSYEDDWRERPIEKVFTLFKRVVEAGVSVDRSINRRKVCDTLAILELVSEIGHLPLWEYVVSKTSEPSEALLAAAARSTNAEVVRYCLSRSANPHISDEEYSFEDYEHAWEVAIDVGQLENAKLLISHGISVGHDLRSQQNLLQQACRGGDAELARLLLRHETSEDFNILEEVAKSGNLELLDKFLNFCRRSKPGFEEIVANAFRQAIREGHDSIAQRLLQVGVHDDLLMGQRDAARLLELAIKNGCNEEISSMLLGAVQFPVGFNNPRFKRLVRDVCPSPLNAAIQKQNFKLVEQLLLRGADVNSPVNRLDGRTALLTAVLAENLNMVSLLLAAGADPNDALALGAAAELENIQMSHKMLEHIIQGHRRRYNTFKREFGGIALQLVIQNHDIARLRYLLMKGLSVDSRFFFYGSLSLFERDTGDSHVGFRWRDARIGETPLGTALRLSCKDNMEQIIELLFEFQSDVNCLVYENYDDGQLSKTTALVAAIETKRLDLVEYMIQKGANIHAPAKGTRGRTALQAAVETRSISLINLLLSHGVEVNEPPAVNGGVTSLQASAIAGIPTITRLLLDHGAKVNAPGAFMNGRTAVEGAAEWGRIDVLQMLLDSGAKLSGEFEEQYRRALKYANQRWHFEADKMLRAAFEKSLSPATAQRRPDNTILADSSVPDNVLQNFDGSLPRDSVIPSEMFLGPGHSYTANYVHSEQEFLILDDPVTSPLGNSRPDREAHPDTGWDFQLGGNPIDAQYFDDAMVEDLGGNSAFSPISFSKLNGLEFGLPDDTPRANGCIWDLSDEQWN